MVALQTQLQAIKNRIARSNAAAEMQQVIVATEALQAAVNEYLRAVATLRDAMAERRQAYALLGASSTPTPRSSTPASPGRRAE
jgi:hypothetical protein